MANTGVATRRRALTGLAAGLVAAAGLSVIPINGASAVADPGMSIAPMPAAAAVSLAQAGELAMWGPYAITTGGSNGDVVFGLEGQTTVPASMAGVAVTQVVGADSATLALTAAGKVVGWGANPNRLERVPATVQAEKVAQITAASGHYAGAVTRDGRVLVWGPKYAYTSPWDIPAGLSGVKQLALTWQGAAALKNDGTVVTWGSWNGGGGNPGDDKTPPPGLRATAIVAGNDTVYALTTSGTVAAWGSSMGGLLDLPDEVKIDHNVKSVAAVDGGAIALLADDTLIAWGDQFAVPAWAQALDPASIVGNRSYLQIVDHDGVVHAGRVGSQYAELSLPPELNGRPVSSQAVADSYAWGAVVVTKMLRAEDPTITGTPAVGNTLTATPGTFSASPTAITGQWLANDAPIPGATGTTLHLTTAQAGKQITYQSTATKTGQDTISSTATALTVPTTTTPGPGTPATVRSSTKITKITVAKKATTLTVTGKITATKPVTGKATITIKKGKKTILTKTLTITTKGTLTLKVKKFGKLVIKKTKSKKKTGYRGAYTATITYTGNNHVKPSTTTKRFTAK